MPVWGLGSLVHSVMEVCLAWDVKSVKINDRTGHRTRYSFGHYSVSFERYDYPRIPQTSPRYALQIYNKRYDHGYDLDTLGYDIR